MSIWRIDAQFRQTKRRIGTAETASDICSYQGDIRQILDQRVFHWRLLDGERPPWAEKTFPASLDYHHSNPARLAGFLNKASFCLPGLYHCLASLRPREGQDTIRTQFRIVCVPLRHMAASVCVPGSNGETFRIFASITLGCIVASSG